MLLVFFSLYGCLFDPAQSIEKPTLQHQTSYQQSGLSADLQYWMLRAYMESQKGNWKQAQNSLQKAQQWAQQDAWFYAHWGDLAWKHKDKKEAITKWRYAIKMFAMEQPKKRAELHRKLDKAGR